VTWVRVDDGFPEHPKIARVGAFGAWLQVQALAYSNRNLTDGFVPSNEVKKLVVSGTEVLDRDGKVWTLSFSYGRQRRGIAEMGWAERMMSAGLWESAPGGIWVHDFLSYQPARVQVEAERAANRERQKRHLERAREKNPNNNEANPNTNGVPNGVTNGVTNDCPVPIPYPSLLGKGRERERESASRSSRSPAFLPPSEQDVRDLVESEKLGPFNASMFVNHYAKKNWLTGKARMTDWRAAVRNAAAEGWTTAKAPPDPPSPAEKVRLEEERVAKERAWRKKMDDEQERDRALYAEERAKRAESEKLAERPEEAR
jgi:hypothetical protein